MQYHQNIAIQNPDTRSLPIAFPHLLLKHQSTTMLPKFEKYYHESIKIDHAQTIITKRLAKFVFSITVEWLLLSSQSKK